MANTGAKLSSFPEVNDIQTGDMFPLLSGGDTNVKIDYVTLADAIIAKLKSEDVVQTQTNSASKLISAALAYSMNQSILQLEEDTSTEQEEKSVTAGIVTVEDADGGGADLTLNLEPHQSGSGDPSPENVRPITGWMGCNVTRTGKNLANIKPDNADNLQRITISGDEGYLTFTSIGEYGRAGYVVTGLKVGQQYTFSAKIAKTVTSNTDSVVYLNNKVTWKYETAYGNFIIGARVKAEELYSRTFVATTDVFFIGFYTSAGRGHPDTITVKEAQLELGSTATAYEPYSGQTYDIAFPSEAGTVYGGSLDVTSGELVVDRVGVTISDLAWTYDSSNTRFTTSSITNVIQKPSADNVPLAGLMSSAYTARAATQLAANDGSIGVLSNGQLLIRDTNYTVASNFVSAMGTQSIVYPLATPQTYQLTPTEVTTLLGDNTVWMDADGKIKLDYKTNAIATKGDVNEAIGRIKALAKITEAIAPVESSYTATQNYSVGDYLIVDYKLYKVTAAIANGGTITVGTNVTTTTIMTEIKALA